MRYPAGFSTWRRTGGAWPESIWFAKRSKSASHPGGAWRFLPFGLRRWRTSHVAAIWVKDVRRGNGRERISLRRSHSTIATGMREFWTTVLAFTP